MSQKLDVSTMDFKVKALISNALNNQFEGYGENHGFGKGFHDLWELLGIATDPENEWYVSLEKSTTLLDIDLTNLPLSVKQNLANYMEKYAIATVSEAVVIIATAFFDARKQDQHGALIDEILGLLAGYLQSSWQQSECDRVPENQLPNNVILERLEALEKRLDAFSKPALQPQEASIKGEGQPLFESACKELDELRSRIKDLTNSAQPRDK